ncbi:hypothetical protein MMC30_001480 [Trapelia coarctata]|nr:hypothetical protein [Trapelia coarctata]
MREKALFLDWELKSGSGRWGARNKVAKPVGAAGEVIGGDAAFGAVTPAEVARGRDVIADLERGPVERRLRERGVVPQSPSGRRGGVREEERARVEESRYRERTTMQARFAPVRMGDGERERVRRETRERRIERSRF